MKNKVLVLTPGYPSNDNPYACAFVHARVKEYEKQGLDVSVCCWNSLTLDDATDLGEYEHVKIRMCNIKGIRSFIEETGPYNVIVAHFADVPLLNVLERESHRAKIILVMHGGDILGESYSCHAGRPYFEADEDDRLHYGEGLPKKTIYRRLVNNDSVHWIFVSEYLKKIVEECRGIKFSKNAHVISNWIQEDLFRYEKKDSELRKKIFFCRRFDNEKVYCIDIVMLGIRRLSKCDFFKDLEFHIFGDGNDYDRLIAPVLEFENVKLHRHFVDNSKLPEVLSDFGIGLYPSRYDSDPVAIREAAQSGLVCIGGDIPSVNAIFPPDEFPIHINPDSPDDLAVLIEKLYRNPSLFLDLSDRMSKRVSDLSCKSKTIDVECDLIRRLAEMAPTVVEGGNSEKLLSVIVPAYNMEKYLDVCIGSLVNHDKVNELEVLVVNDGSKDSTLEVAEKWAKRYPSSIKVVNKKNGGHGSCINTAITLATGRYVRIVDADDWVISANLAKQIERLRNETADCVLTYGQYDYVENGQTAPIFQYPNLVDNAKRSFDDMQFDGYGFKGYGPTLSTSSWKRTVLLESGVKITEGVAYADMQWNIMPLKVAEDFVLYDLDVYRYTMGRAGQTVSRETVFKRWKDHNKVFMEAVKFAIESKELTPAKRYYIFHNVLGEFGCNNIFVLHTARDMSEVNNFLMQMMGFGNKDLLREVISFTFNQNGTSLEILKASSIGRKLIRQYARKSNYRLQFEAGERIRGRQFSVIGIKSFFFFVRALIDRMGIKKSVRRFIKGMLPYGLVRKWQQRIYGM